MSSLYFSCMYKALICQWTMPKWYKSAQSSILLKLTHVPRGGSC